MLRALCIAAVLLGGSRLALSQVTAEELFENHDQMAEGTNVRFQAALVRAKTGNLLRVAIDHHEIFVAPMDPSSLEFIAVGSRVNVDGTLRPTPAAQQARKVYAMGPAEAKRLARTPFYVEAWSVSVID